VEACLIHSLTFEQLKLALKKYPSFQEHRAELLEKYYLLGEEREELRQQENAYAQFCYLVGHYRDLIDRVPDKYLASFISTTPQYYSELKRQYIERNGRI
jgi:hypothetical protein